MLFRCTRGCSERGVESSFTRGVVVRSSDTESTRGFVGHVESSTEVTIVRIGARVNIDEDEPGSTRGTVHEKEDPVAQQRRR